MTDNTDSNPDVMGKGDATDGDLMGTDGTDQELMGDGDATDGSTMGSDDGDDESLTGEDGDDDVVVLTTSRMSRANTVHCSKDALECNFV
jgi:hypothetical protein